MKELILLGFGVSALSITIAKGTIFKNLRDWTGRKSKFFGGLLTCTYCLSHWVALFLVLIYKPEPFGYTSIINCIVAVFVLVGVSSLITGVILSLPPLKQQEVPVEVQQELSFLRETLEKAKLALKTKRMEEKRTEEETLKGY